MYSSDWGCNSGTAVTHSAESEQWQIIGSVKRVQEKDIRGPDGKGVAEMNVGDKRRRRKGQGREGGEDLQQSQPLHFDVTPAL